MSHGHSKDIIGNPFIYIGNKHNSKYRISPSQFSKFVSTNWTWYRESVLGLDKFEGNTASVIGTCVHLCAEYAALGKPITHDMICTWLDELPYHVDIDIEEVKLQYKAPAIALVNQYVLQHKMLYVEKDLEYKLTDDILVSGQLDRLEGSKDDCMIVDYKSYNSKTKPKYIPQHYKTQLLAYDYLARKNGYNPTRMRLVYVNREIDDRYISDKTGKECGKIHPSEVTVLTEEITQEDRDFIDGMIELFVDTIEASEKYPELKHVIWHDIRNKER